MCLGTCCLEALQETEGVVCQAKWYISKMDSDTVVGTPEMLGDYSVESDKFGDFEVSEQATEYESSSNNEIPQNVILVKQKKKRT